MSETIHILRTIRENGYRLTAAREAIIDALTTCTGHVTADQLVIAVRRNSPSVGRMTVYRTLDLLMILGLIRPIYQGTAAARYVLMDKGHHHHLVCTICHDVIELDTCTIQDMEQRIGKSHQYEIQGHLLEIYGRCPTCKS